MDNLIEEQRLKAIHMRRNGIMFKLLNELSDIQKKKGDSGLTRAPYQVCIKDNCGLSPAATDIMHLTVGGNHKNYLVSHADYMIDDIKKG